MTFIIIGAVVVALSLGVAIVVATQPGVERLPRERRRPMVDQQDSLLAGAADTATSVVGRLLGARSRDLARKLDVAGIRQRPQDFAFLVAVGALVLVALTLVRGGGWWSVVAAALSPVAALLLVNLRIEKRRTQFTEQLDATLQLMASSLRAGYSMMQALSSVAKQSEEPSASELGRVVNETRVGRPVVSALEEAADRMESDDFRWATQAIAINREVGGSLAETLDGVAATIRERGQVRRQVQTLSAEGRLSAIILVVLPFFVAGFVMLVNPTYLTPLVQSPAGIGMLAAGGVMMIIGSFWLSKVVKIEF